MIKQKNKFKVGEDFPKILKVGNRLDKAVTLLLTDEDFSELVENLKVMLSRTIVAAHLQKFVTVNDNTEKNSYRLEDGDVISLDVSSLKKQLERELSKRAAIENIKPEPGFVDKINIIDENADFVVIDKPHGIPVHPGVGNESGTIANLYKQYLMDKDLYDSRLERAGIVHRLDKSVGGIMLLAKNYEAQKALKALFEKHEINKVYRASVEVVNAYKAKALAIPVIENCDDEGFLEDSVKSEFANWMRVEGYIGRSHSDRKKMQFLMNSKGDRAFKRAVSWICNDGNDLFISIETGRTHQIRATLEYLGYRIKGDLLYGGKPKRSPSMITSIELRSIFLSFEFGGKEYLYKL